MDPRFDLPLYTRAEVALQLGLPPTTLGDWLRSGALEAGSGGRGEPTITFAGLVETHMLRQLRHGRASPCRRSAKPQSRCDHAPGGATRSPGPALAYDGRDLLIEITAEGREAGLGAHPRQPGRPPRRPAAWISRDRLVRRRVRRDAPAGHLPRHRRDRGPRTSPRPARSSKAPTSPSKDVVDHVRTGSSYREIATKFALEDYEVEALVRPHIRPPAVRKARHAPARAQPLL